MNANPNEILRVSDLKKTFRIGFFRRTVEAVKGISFEISSGEIFGLLGPNGAGKTTTIKMLLQLIYPDEGNITFFGNASEHNEALKRIGYMPENPYVYQYLHPMEFLDLCGRLTGMAASARQTRAATLIQRVGLTHALNRPIGKFSKGMMQRIGLAQALLHDPEFIILDEPMSGLDPIGRKEVRELILEEKSKGKTILFTSHILSDVETLCDRVAIMQRGEIQHTGLLSHLLSEETSLREVQLQKVSDSLLSKLRGNNLQIVSEDPFACHLDKDALQDFLTETSREGAEILSVSPVRKRLEELFITDEQ